MNSEIFNLPANKNFVVQNVSVPYVFVGDDASPLGKRILKPYPNRGLTIEKHINNNKLSRARRVIENFFGILANRFKVLLNTINLSWRVVHYTII